MTHLERWWKSNRLLTSNWWRSIIRGMMQCLSASMTPLMFSTSITKLRMPSRGRPAQTLHTCVGCQRVTAQWDKRDVALRNIMSYLTHHDASWRIVTVSKWDNNGGEQIYQLQLASVTTWRHTLWRWFGATFDTFEVGHLRAMSAWQIWQAPRCRKLSNGSFMLFLHVPSITLRIKTMSVHAEHMSALWREPNCDLRVVKSFQVFTMSLSLLVSDRTRLKLNRRRSVVAT